MFNVKIAAQVASVFTRKAGGNINILKLMKLLYLSERKSMELHGMPMFYDCLVSMEHGPVLSQTLNLINGAVSGEPGRQWDEWLSDRENHEIGLVNQNFADEELDHLSVSALEITEEIWSEFGHMNKFELVDYTHKNCPEWEDPKGSSIAIDPKKVLTSVGFTAEEAELQAVEIEYFRNIDQAFAIQH